MNFRNYKQFTHGEDVDGISCVISLAFGLWCDYKDLEVSYEDYHSINNSLEKFIDMEEYKTYSKIFITDIGISEEIAKKIDSVHCEEHKFMLIDHHDTNMFLNKYSWAKVVPTDNIGRKQSATKLIYNLFNSNLELGYDKRLFNFVNLVSDYDTYLWFTEGNIDPKKIHVLFNAYGKEKFLQTFYTRILCGVEGLFIDQDETIFKILEEKERNYIQEKIYDVRIIHVMGYKIGVVYCDQKDYISQLGNQICLQLDVDIAAMIDLNKNKMSYRSVSDNFHLGVDFASMYKGGGHEKAAGSEIHPSVHERIVQDIFHIGSRDVKNG